MSPNSPNRHNFDSSIVTPTFSPLNQLPMSDTKIGILGLGIIGQIWAQHYHSAGLLCATWNRPPKPDSPRWQDSAGTVAKTADIIHLVVADPAAVPSILTQIAPQLNASKIVVQSSTIDPESSDRFRTIVTATRRCPKDVVAQKTSRLDF
jgi:prephenate dehydrogenase